MKRIAPGLLFSFFIPVIAVAQPVQKGYNSLLWRISGKGLSAPSYLYGTMHLTDKRLFNFPDSLYHSLEQTAGFAAELDMREMMSRIIEGINDDKEKNLLIKDLVRPEWIAPYREKLATTFKKKFEIITFGDVKGLKSKFSNQLLKSGEMATIMDAYLFDIAKRQGKWVGGIEDYDDQMKTGKEEEVMSALDEIFTDKKLANQKIEWMIHIYLNEQLDTIDLTSQLWQGSEKSKLVRRNVKMARRIDSIMQLRTCLFAIGAAHIPGDSGVVKLLRERGFTVDPVYTSRRIEPLKYIYTSKAIPWSDAEIKGNWYSIQMPGKPEPLNLGTNNPDFNSQLYLDLATMNAYFSFGFPASTAKQLNADSAYAVMAKKFSKGGMIVSSKAIIVSGTPGKEYVVKSDGNDIRLQVFLPPSAVVINMISSYKDDSLFGSDARHFFESFHILKDPFAAAQPRWQRFSFPDHAFGIEFPGSYEKPKKPGAVDSLWKTQYYVSNSPGGELSCWMMVMESKEGYYSDSDSGYFSLLRKGLADRFKASATVTQTWKQSNFDDYPGYELVQKMKYKTESLQLKGRVINRGSRRYFFYAVFSESEKGLLQADEYLNSFEFLPLPQLQWNYHSSPSTDISIWSPAEIQYQRGEDSISVIPDYIIYDSAAPASILIKKQFLSPYSWWDSDSAFFSQQANRYSEDADSLKNFSFTRKGEIGEADFQVNLKDNHIVKKVHLLLNGDTLYSVFVFVPPALLKEDNYSRLFNTIKISKIKQAGYHLSHKTDRILKDLEEGDSASFASAVEALNDASFTAEDLPKLQKAILQSYRDFDANAEGAHRKLVNKILEIDNGSTYDFIKNNYPFLTGSREKLKYPFLYCLLGLKTKESFHLFKEIITKQLPQNGNAESIRFVLNDSLPLTAAIFPDLLVASKDTEFIKMLPFVANRLLDSGLIQKATLRPYKENFYALTGREISRLKKELPDYDYTASQHIKLLSTFNEAAAYRLLEQFLLLPAISIKERAAIALIKCGQKTDPVQLQNIAKSNYYRITLYEELEELGQQKLFPAKYYTQQLFAQSELFQNASDDYDPDSVLFIAEKTAAFMGKQERFYLFKIVYTPQDAEPESYLGIAGPYPKQSGKIIVRSKIGGLYTDESYDTKKINSQCKDYLKQMEEYIKENKEE